MTPPRTKQLRTQRVSGRRLGRGQRCTGAQRTWRVTCSSHPNYSRATSTGTSGNRWQMHVMTHNASNALTTPTQTTPAGRRTGMTHFNWVAARTATFFRSRSRRVCTTNSTKQKSRSRQSRATHHLTAGCRISCSCRRLGQWTTDMRRWASVWSLCSHRSSRLRSTHARCTCTRSVSGCRNSLACIFSRSSSLGTTTRSMRCSCPWANLIASPPLFSTSRFFHLGCYSQQCLPILSGKT
mmetsp:Transcript_26109/g.66299  ORF Transcript_26109/g.66299 Transcript_26109/m.66299 type:complete len:239 (-) Transcript_26109:3282-3998(-)